MELYHGSDVTVERPVILPDLRALDFGGGFYLTSSRSQATTWARSVARRRRSLTPVLNVYEMPSSALGDLEVLRFEGADEAWLDFVVANRKRLSVPSSYDVVIGPVADDSTLPVINEYMAGTYPKHIAIELLLPQNLTDQYAFLTQRALDRLRFKEGVVL